MKHINHTLTSVIFFHSSVLIIFNLRCNYPCRLEFRKTYRTNLAEFAAVTQHIALLRLLHGFLLHHCFFNIRCCKSVALRHTVRTPEAFREVIFIQRNNCFFSNDCFCDRLKLTAKDICRIAFLRKCFACANEFVTNITFFAVI